MNTKPLEAKIANYSSVKAVKDGSKDAEACCEEEYWKYFKGISFHEVPCMRMMKKLQVSLLKGVGCSCKGSYCEY